MATRLEHGRLEETPFPRLLLALWQERFAGSLTLARERIGKRFLFLAGAPVHAESNLASESLGVQLMDAGRLSRADYTRVALRVDREGCKEGKALLDLGLIDARGLFLALKQQVRVRLLECFGWPGGEFHVDRSSPPAADARPLGTSPIGLLQEGLAAHWSPERILADLASCMELYPRPGSRFRDRVRELQRDESVDALLAGLDGERTLWRALQAARTPGALAACWVLRETGALAFSEAPLLAGAGPPPEVELVVEEPTSAAPAHGQREAPAPARGHPASLPPHAELLAEIDDRFERLGEIDHYALLGVARSADPTAIKQAYHRAAKTYHPDALARLGFVAEARQRATRVFAAIGKAHAELADPERKRAYDASLVGDGGALDADRLANAETNYRKGEILLRQGNFRGAVDYLRAAVDLWPDEAAYRSALGWALFKKHPPDLVGARDHLERAVALDARDAVALSRLASVLRDLGLETREPEPLGA